MLCGLNCCCVTAPFGVHTLWHSLHPRCVMWVVHVPPPPSTFACWSHHAHMQRTHEQVICRECDNCTYTALVLTAGVAPGIATTTLSSHFTAHHTVVLWCVLLTTRASQGGLHVARCRCKQANRCCTHLSTRLHTLGRCLYKWWSTIQRCASCVCLVVFKQHYMVALSCG